MRIIIIAACLCLAGCSTPTQRAEAEHRAFISTSIFAALWFAHTEFPPTGYPTGIKSVDEILVELPESERQPVLAEAIKIWESQR